MIDQKTTNRDYPLPHADNKLREDVVRLNDAFADIDTDVDDLYDTTGNLSTQLTSLTQDAQNGVLWHADLNGQTSGQDLRCRYQTSQGKDQFLHSWGLQAKS
jgi:hypothetical protein